MSILIFLVVSYVLLSITLMKVFEKAGEQGWKALVPGLNFAVWCRLIGRSPWHALWLLFPIVNIFVYCGMAVDLVRSFNWLGFSETALAVIYAPISFFRLGRDPKAKYEGPILTREAEYRSQITDAETRKDSAAFSKLVKNNPYRKASTREWAEAIFFAVFAAAFIRMFLIEAYVIPTSSMEGSLLIGDFLFVSKAHYGIRTPMTILQIPLLHNRLPRGVGESYLRKPSLGYHRLPAFEKINNLDPVVFNFPEGDSIYFDAARTYTIHDVRRVPQLAMLTAGKDLVARPIDKKDHYIKRCIGIPGDSLQIREGQVFINGSALKNPKFMQFGYRVVSPTPLNFSTLEEMGVTLSDNDAQNGYFNLNAEQVEKIRAMGNGITVEKQKSLPPNPIYLYPHDPAHFPLWTVDNFGPIYIPKHGATVAISPANIALYHRAIAVYEHNTLEIKGGQIYINGSAANSYTFRQDYYWMQGDNRHNSEDSRVWGFVPADHIVGKPLFVWMSAKGGNPVNGIRGSRIFRSVKSLSGF